MSRQGYTDTVVVCRPCTGNRSLIPDQQMLPEIDKSLTWSVLTFHSTESGCLAPPPHAFTVSSVSYWLWATIKSSSRLVLALHSTYLEHTAAINTGTLRLALAVNFRRGEPRKSILCDSIDNFYAVSAGPSRGCIKGVTFVGPRRRPEIHIKYTVGLRQNVPF